jgi:hypothetical protein
MTSSVVLLLALCAPSQVTVDVKDSNGDPVADVRVEAAKDEDFKADSLLGPRGDTNDKGQVVLPGVTARSVRKVETLYIRAYKKAADGTVLRGPCTKLKIKGKVPDEHIDAVFDRTIRTITPNNSSANLVLANMAANEDGTCCGRRRFPILRMLLRVPRAAYTIVSGEAVASDCRNSGEMLSRSEALAVQAEEQPQSNKQTMTDMPKIGER